MRGLSCLPPPPLPGTLTLPPPSTPMQTEAMREEYVATRMEAASAAGQCGGAHLALVDRFVQKHGKVGGVGWDGVGERGVRQR